MIIPEINPEHVKIIEEQKKRLGSGQSLKVFPAPEIA